MAATPTHNWQLRLPEDASSAAAGLTLEAFGLGNGSNGFGPMSPGSAWLEDVSSPVLDLTGGLTPPACLPPEPPQSTYDACDGRAGPVVAASDGRGADGWLMNPPRFVAPTPTLELLYRNPEERALVSRWLNIAHLWPARPSLTSIRARFLTIRRSSSSLSRSRTPTVIKPRLRSKGVWADVHARLPAASSLSGDPKRRAVPLSLRLRFCQTGRRISAPSRASTCFCPILTSPTFCRSRAARAWRPTPSRSP